MGILRVGRLVNSVHSFSEAVRHPSVAADLIGLGEPWTTDVIEFVVAGVVTPRTTIGSWPLRLCFLQDFLLDLSVLEEVLIYYDGCLLFLQVLLLEPGFLEYDFELGGELLDVERLRDRIPAVVLLPQEQPGLR